ncbi:GNAT family N-acetyltransferase [Filobacillus milosensis]|uniref:GNAT family N-acetyltransferase n=1 Tax=Filobacillus milosensis TaxID=94137 RepID=UPI0038990ED6
MEIKRDEKGFYVGNPSNKDAEITFVKKDEDTIDIDHTEVSENLQGQGVGGKLVQAVVDYARENNLNITATCPYAEKKLSRTDEYLDVFVG